MAAALRRAVRARRGPPPRVRRRSARAPRRLRRGDAPRRRVVARARARGARRGSARLARRAPSRADAGFGAGPRRLGGRRCRRARRRSRERGLADAARLLLPLGVEGAALPRDRRRGLLLPRRPLGVAVPPRLPAARSRASDAPFARRRKLERAGGPGALGAGRGAPLRRAAWRARGRGPGGGAARGRDRGGRGALRRLRRRLRAGGRGRSAAGAGAPARAAGARERPGADRRPLLATRHRRRARGSVEDRGRAARALDRRRRRGDAHAPESPPAPVRPPRADGAADARRRAPLVRARARLPALPRDQRRELALGARDGDLPRGRRMRAPPRLGVRAAPARRAAVRRLVSPSRARRGGRRAPARALLRGLLHGPGRDPLLRSLDAPAPPLPPAAGDLRAGRGAFPRRRGATWPTDARRPESAR